MIIYDLLKKGNRVLFKAFWPLCIILVAFGIFGGIQLYTVHAHTISVTIKKELLPTTSVSAVTSSTEERNIQSESATTTSSQGKYVASRTGKSYYLPSCGASKRIAEKNKVWFATKEEAAKAGYAPAKNCKGI